MNMGIGKSLPNRRTLSLHESIEPKKEGLRRLQYSAVELLLNANQNEQSCIGGLKGLHFYKTTYMKLLKLKFKIYNLLISR